MFFQQRFLYVLHDIVNIFCVTQRTWKFCEFFFQTVKDIWKVSHSIHNYENFPFSGWSKMCLHCNGDQKKFWWKKFFIEISDSKFTFFMGIWGSLNPSSCLLLACNWLKYDYGKFSQSLGVAKHVRIGLKSIKNFCWNKSFHRNFWLKFDISHEAITRKVPYVTTLSVKKKFWDLTVVV